jgi:hypothetical protein
MTIPVLSSNVRVGPVVVKLLCSAGIHHFTKRRQRSFFAFFVSRIVGSKSLTVLGVLGVGHQLPKSAKVSRIQNLARRLWKAGDNSLKWF